MIVGGTKAVMQPPGGTPNPQKQAPVSKELIRVVVHNNQKPSVSLSIVLDRPPSAQESIAPLIRNGIFTIEVERGNTIGTVPIFSRKVIYQLKHDGKLLAEMVSSGTNARASISVSFNRDQCIDMLQAFDKRDSAFEMHAIVQLREEIMVNSVTPAGIAVSLQKQRVTEKFLLSRMSDLFTRQINSEEHVQLVADNQGDPTRVVTIPRKVTIRPPRRSSLNGMEKKVAWIGNSLTALTQATLPATDNAAFIKPQHFAINNAVLLEDIKIELGGIKKVLNLPVVNDPSAAYWPDRRDVKKAWYAPEFKLVMPALNADPSVSPFLFRYETIGVTTSGKPALKATLRFTLEKTMAEITATALSSKGIESSDAVKFESLSLSVLLPFVDETDGKTKQHAFMASVTEEGSLVKAEVEILNDWVRLAYGALAVDNYQSIPVELQLNFTFKCYVAIRNNELELVFGAKTMVTPVLHTAAQLARSHSSTYIDASALRYVNPVSQLKFQKEKRSIAKSKNGEATPLIMAKPLNYTVAAAQIKPQVIVNADVITSFNKIKYALRTQLTQHSLPMLFACNRFGNFYQEVKEGSSVAIGCQDAFRLGEIKYRQYEEIIELRDDLFQMYRSLSQPGYFVVVPAQFCISRREKTEPDAYRPLIFVNALIDPQTAANNKVELRVTLQPDIPEYKRDEIFAKLKDFHASPTIAYSTDIAADSVIFNWALDPSIAANCQAYISDAAGPFLSTYFLMDLANWQLIRTILSAPGLGGNIVIRLSDGTEFSSNILLKLDQVAGPWTGGPLELKFADGQVSIINKIERTIDVTELVTYSGDTVSERVPVEVSLSPAGLHNLPATAGMSAIYSYPLTDPVALEETRSFVEEIYGNVVFINLVNFDNHQLLRLDIEATIKNVEGTHRGTLSDDVRVVDFKYVLPLTTYFEAHAVQFIITKIFSDRPAEVTGLIEWDLNRGPVSITHELLSL